MIYEPMPYRKCKVCGEQKKICDFFVNRSLKSKRERTCRTCYSLSRGHKPYQPPTIADGTMKCSACGRELPLTSEYFPKNKIVKMGFDSQCKSCRREYQAQYRRNNHERLTQRNRDYYASHKDDYREYGRDRYRAKRNSMRDRYHAYYLRNKDKILARVRAYNHPDLARKRQVSTASHARRQARKRSLPDTFNSKDWQRCLDYFDGRCAICGRLAGLWHTLAADHWIPLSSLDCPGTVPTNIIPLCHGVDGCNNSKGQRRAEEWLIEKCGVQKAAQILNKIESYFRSLTLETQPSFADSHPETL